MKRDGSGDGDGDDDGRTKVKSHEISQHEIPHAVIPQQQQQQQLSSAPIASVQLNDAGGQCLARCS